MDDFLYVEFSFNCLGSWPGGPYGSTYVALMDNDAVKENRPQYRCGVSIIKKCKEKKKERKKGRKMLFCTL